MEYRPEQKIEPSSEPPSRPTTLAPLVSNQFRQQQMKSGLGAGTKERSYLGPETEREEIIDLQEGIWQSHHAQTGSSKDSDGEEELTPEGAKARTPLFERCAGNAAPHPATNGIDQEKLQTACPVGQNTMATFSLDEFEEMDITSAGFMPCVAVLFEHANPSGKGKRVGFTHLSEDDPEASGLGELIAAVGGPAKLKVYLGVFCKWGITGSGTLFALLSWLDEQGITVTGFTQMLATKNGGTLMASLSGSDAPKFSTTSDEEVGQQMEKREAALREKHPVLSEIDHEEAEHRAHLNRLRDELAQMKAPAPTQPTANAQNAPQRPARANPGLQLALAAKEEELAKATADFDAFGNDPTRKKFPMTFHPESGANGFQGKTWSMPDKSEQKEKTSEEKK